MHYAFLYVAALQRGTRQRFSGWRDTKTIESTKMRRMRDTLLAVVLVFGARYAAAQFDAADRVADTAPVYQLHGSGTSNPAQLVWKAGAGAGRLREWTRLSAESRSRPTEVPSLTARVSGTTLVSNKKPWCQKQQLQCLRSWHVVYPCTN